MAVSDLTGYTWVGNDSGIQYPSASDTIFEVNFISNNTNYTRIVIWNDPPFDYGIRYSTSDSGIFVYINSWSNEAYKTIIITGGTDATNATLIAWLEANGTLTAPAPAEPLTSSFNETSVVDNSAYLSLYINGVEFKLEKGTASVSLISFYVDSSVELAPVVSYQAEQDMTWTEWVASAYNTDGFYISADSIVDASGNYRLQNSLENVVLPQDEIISGATYTKVPYGGGGD